MNKKRTGLLLLLLLVLLVLARGWFLIRGQPEEVRTKAYSIARDATWFPFDFLGKERQVAAFSDDLLLAIAEQEKLRIRIYEASAHFLFPSLGRRTYDGVLSPMPPQSVIFDEYLSSQPYYQFGAVLIVRESSNIKKLSDLKEGVLGLIRGSPFTFNEPVAGGVNFLVFDSANFALQKLVEGGVDGVVLDNFSARAYIQGLFFGKLRIIPTPLTDQALRLFTLHNEEGKKLIEAFNRGLEAVKKEGTYDTLLAKWGLINSGAPLPERP